MRGRDVVLESLVAHGVEFLFGNPGTTESPLTDNLGARLEFSRDDRTQPALADEEIDTFSLEGLFRF